MNLWKSYNVLVWLSVWSKVEMICIWSNWCTATRSSLASLKSQMVLFFWYWLNQAVMEMRSLSGCTCSSYRSFWLWLGGSTHSSCTTRQIRPGDNNTECNSSNTHTHTHTHVSMKQMLHDDTFTQWQHSNQWAADIVSVWLTTFV